MFLWVYVFVSLREILRSRIAEVQGRHVFSSVRNWSGLFSQSVQTTFHLLILYESSDGLTLSQHSVFRHLTFRHAGRYVVVYHCGFNISLMINGSEHFSHTSWLVIHVLL